MGRGGRRTATLPAATPSSRQTELRQVDLTETLRIVLPTARRAKASDHQGRVNQT